MALKLITPPANLPVTLADAKIHERIDIVDDANDASILALLAAATLMAENYTRRAFITQTWRYQTPYIYPIISLPRPPFIAVDPDEVMFIDSYNVRTPILPIKYFINDTYEPARFIWKGLQVDGPFGGSCCCGFDELGFTADIISIEYEAGYGDDPVDVPMELREGILQIFGSLYENRESQMIPDGAIQLLRPYKVEYL